MANESNAKKTVTTNNSTDAKKVSAKKSVSTATKKKVPTKATIAKPTAKKKASAKPKTPTTTQAVKKTPSKAVVSTKKAKPSVIKTTAPKTSETKKIAVEETKKTVPATKEKEVSEHLGIYILLLSAVLIAIHVMSRFNLNIGTVNVGYSVVLFPAVFFIANVITKKFDFLKTIIAILSSTIALIVFVYLSKYLNSKVIDYFAFYGQIFAYIISQLLNLIIYYYLLINTELKARWIFVTYIVGIIAFNIIELLFLTRIVVTDNFYITIMCSIVLSSIIAVMFAFFDSLIRRGIE